MNVSKIDLKTIGPKTKTTLKLDMVQNALGDYWQVPVMIAKGTDGPVVGITAVLHGNELNGIPIIHQLWKKIDETALKGTLVCVPVLNAPGFLSNEREFPEDGKDLNRIMPGKPHGSSSEVYANAIIKRLISNLDYLIDLHTASFGRINSLYVRADLSDSKIAKMAALQEPQIIVNKPGEPGTLRGEAANLGIPAITIEAGDPSVFQKKHIRPSTFGLNNVLVELGMIDEEMEEIAHDAIVCEKSYWIYAKSGGILRVTPGLAESVTKGEEIANVSDIFGNVIQTINAPEDSILVAKSTNPVCQVGSRVAHLGILRPELPRG